MITQRPVTGSRRSSGIESVLKDLDDRRARVEMDRHDVEAARAVGHVGAHHVVARELGDSSALESGDRFEFNWVPWYEYLPEPFALAEGVTLPVGGYRYDRFRLEFETSRHRPWEFGTTTWFGSFYNGRLLQQMNYLRFTSAKGTWQAGLSTEHNFGTLKQGKFVQRLWQLNLTYAFSPNLVLTNFLQYDTESQSVGNNMRLRWTIKPGNDLFVVWNRGWKRLFLSRDDINLIPETELLAVKLRWTFRR